MDLRLHPSRRRSGTMNRRHSPLDPISPNPATWRVSSESRLTLGTAVLLAISLGLAGGYLEVLIIVLKKRFWNDVAIFGIGSDFPWSVPVGHAILLTIPAVILAAASRLRPRPLSLRAGSWLFATLAIWAALLRMPLYGVASLFLAAGMGKLISGVVAVHCGRPRQVRYTLAGLLGLLLILTAYSSGLKALRRDRGPVGSPAPPSNARNVLMIVWDTVRADHLSLHGYPRDTTPNLARWAQKGVRYDLALAPAPWTYPSHSCFLTGHWPFKLESRGAYALDVGIATLAEYLASRGYQTAGFSANTVFCSYETGLDRGFTDFDDYPLTLRSFLGRTAAGNWMLKNILSRGDYYESKWLRFQSRNAEGINSAFLNWLRRRAANRPFFAFLN